MKSFIIGVLLLTGCKSEEVNKPMNSSIHDTHDSASEGPPPNYTKRQVDLLANDLEKNDIESAINLLDFFRNKSNLNARDALLKQKSMNLLALNGYCAQAKSLLKEFYGSYAPEIDISEVTRIAKLCGEKNGIIDTKVVSS